ncbi:polysaccharide pyruvyl transferase family protein [Yeosuana sp. AK3]
MNKLILYPHGGSGNHGCEAIVRSTIVILEQTMPNNYGEIILSSTRKYEDEKVGLQHICTIVNEQETLNRLSFNYVFGVIKRNLFGDKEFFERYAYRNIFNNASKNTLALSIGGDNYCYGRPGLIYFMNSHLRKKHTNTVLWGCSIEPKAMDAEMVADLKSFKFVFARETFTYNALLEKGISGARLCPDPAFLLKTEETSLPKGFQEGNTVGINISPLIMSLETNEGVAFKNYIELITYIIEETNQQIALIPHVMWDHNDDRKPLDALYNQFKHTGRLVYVAQQDDLNCLQLKYAISKCSMLVTARTHASIAAYSQCVPTLVVGYSVKAQGIATDLFGTTEGYVFPVQALTHKENLVNEFKTFYNRTGEIKQHLIEIMPEYKARILKAAKELINI